MDNSVFLIVKRTRSSISDAGRPLLETSLMNSGMPGEIDKFAPAFATHEAAEDYRKQKDKYDFYETLELKVAS